jgi:hypothetical protein
MGVESGEEKHEQLHIIAPYVYDAGDLGHPYSLFWALPCVVIDTSSMVILFVALGIFCRKIFFAYIRVRK